MSTAQLDAPTLAMAALSDADIARLARALAPHLASHLSSEALWVAQDIADYLRCSVSQVRDRLVKARDFPRPIRLPACDGSFTFPRWRAQEVRDWAMHHQERGNR